MSDRETYRQTDAWINSQANNEGGMDGDQYNAQRVSQMILQDVLHLQSISGG